MGFWDLMIRKDDLVCSLFNKVVFIKNRLNLKERKLIRRTQAASPAGIGRNTFIILNGPSLKKQELSVLKGKSVMFVNRGFKHPLYRELQPEYHVFVDNKLLTGEWPINWLDEIVQMVPDIIFVMPVSWAFKDIIKPYVQRGFSFYWLETNEPLTCLGVSGSCFDFAIKQKFDNIYFTGFDANGIAFELVKESSHFYGVNEDNLKKSTKNYAIDLYMHSRHLNDLNRFATQCKKNKVSIINLTDGGLLDMFPRLELSHIK